MRYRNLLSIIIFGMGCFVAGCSEKEEELHADKGWDENQTKLREKIGRYGTVSTALSNYKMAIGDYPSTSQGLKALLERPGGMSDPALWQGPYLEDPEQLIDIWGKDFSYKYPGDTHEKQYDITSAGPDGQLGNDDDINNWTIR